MMIDAEILAKGFGIIFVADLITGSSIFRYLRSLVTRFRVWSRARSRATHPLRKMQFHASEYALRVSDRVTLACRADEIWEDESGLSVPVETKTRDTLYPGDVIELSAVAYALRHQEDDRRAHRIAPYGYVRLAPIGEEPRLIRVRLLSDAQVENLISRYLALRCGLAIPNSSPRENKCRSCAYGRFHCADSLC